MPGASRSGARIPGQACQAPPIPLWPGARARKLSGTDRPTDRLTDGQRHRQRPMAVPDEPCVGPRVSVCARPTLLPLVCRIPQVVTLGRGGTPQIRGQMNGRPRVAPKTACRGERGSRPSGEGDFDPHLHKASGPPTSLMPALSKGLKGQS